VVLFERNETVSFITRHPDFFNSGKISNMTSRKKHASTSSIPSSNLTSPNSAPLDLVDLLFDLEGFEVVEFGLVRLELGMELVLACFFLVWSAYLYSQVNEVCIPSRSVQIKQLALPYHQ